VGLLISGLVSGRQPGEPTQFFVKFRETDRTLFLLGIAQLGLNAVDPGQHLAQLGVGLPGGGLAVGDVPSPSSQLGGGGGFELGGRLLGGVQDRLRLRLGLGELLTAAGLGLADRGFPLAKALQGL